VLAVRTEDGAGEAAAQLAASLRAAGTRVELDVRTELSFGRRVVGWELKGVPVRLEVGPRDLASGTVVLCRRDDATKAPVRLAEAVGEVAKVLEAAQASLMAEARELRNGRTVDVRSLEEVEEATQSGFAVVPGSLLTSGDGQGEERLNAAGVSVRVLQKPDGSLPSPGEDVADLVAVVARAY
jgi:prolyl-tRNA synthetase